MRLTPTGTTISASTAAVTVARAPRRGARARTQRGEARGNDAAQRRVVEQEQAQQHGQQVEEVVVAGEHDQRLKQRSRTTPRAPADGAAAKMRNSNPSSTASVAAVPAASSACGSCAAYHASGVGSGCVQK